MLTLSFVVHDPEQTNGMSKKHDEFALGAKLMRLF